MRQKLFILVISICTLFVPKYIFAIEPDVFIQSTVNRAANTLGGNFTKQERIEKLKK